MLLKKRYSFLVILPCIRSAAKRSGAVERQIALILPVQYANTAAGDLIADDQSKRRSSRYAAGDSVIHCVRNLVVADCVTTIRGNTVTAAFAYLAILYRVGDPISDTNTRSKDGQDAHIFNRVIGVVTARRAFQGNATEEAVDGAVLDCDVPPIIGEDALCQGARAAGRATDKMALEIDCHITGIDGDGVAGTAGKDQSGIKHVVPWNADRGRGAR
jgi:hypothetical protein